jgi:hypothetical protein
VLGKGAGLGSGVLIGRMSIVYSKFFEDGEEEAMERIKEVLLLVSTAVMVSAGAVAASNPVQLAQAVTKFDGTWDAVMTSNEDPCPTRFDYVVTVKNGELSGVISGKLNDYDLEGKVLADGTLDDGEASYYERRMELEGKFSDTVAKGTFYTFGVTTDCGGKFTFTRRK